MLLQFLQDLADIFPVVLQVFLFCFMCFPPGVDGHVVHVYCEPHLCDFMCEY